MIIKHVLLKALLKRITVYPAYRQLQIFEKNNIETALKLDETEELNSTLV
jgi:hypothetical protein